MHETGDPGKTGTIECEEVAKGTKARREAQRHRVLKQVLRYDER